MEVTCATKAIVLKSEPWNECDSRVVLYTKEKGKVELVARGTKKLSSKLASHLEPFNFLDLMIVNGKVLNYVGGASSIDCFSDLKQDLGKLEAGGKVLSWFHRTFKVDEEDEQAFNILRNFLDLLNRVKSETIYYQLLSKITILKLLVNLGYRPDLDICAVCGKVINQEHIRLDLIQGNAVCLNCHTRNSNLTLNVSMECVAKLKMIMDNDFDYIIKNLKINHALADEVNIVIDNLSKIYIS